MKMSRKVVTACATAGAIAAVLGGVAAASIPDSAGVIHACYTRSSGALRIADTTACTSKETALSWNNVGPAGLTWQGQWRDQTLGGNNYRVANTAEAVVKLTFEGTDVHLRGRAGASEGQIYVTIDGQPPGAAHGFDVDEAGIGTVTEQRLHQLIRQSGPIYDRYYK